MIIPLITCMSKFALLIFGGMMPGGPGSLRGSHFRCNRHHHHRGHHDDDDDNDRHNHHQEDDYVYIDNCEEAPLMMTMKT